MTAPEDREEGLPERGVDKPLIRATNPDETWDFFGVEEGFRNATEVLGTVTCDVVSQKVGYFWSLEEEEVQTE